MKNYKGKRGITLLALIITIIVLLLLAGVVISSLTGETGIIRMVDKVAKTSNEVAEEEAFKLKQLELLTKKIPSIEEINDINGKIDGLPPKKTLDEFPDYIPIYTPKQFQKIASGETNYAIRNSSGTLVGNYNMTADAKYVLMQDLDFSTQTGVQPIKGFRGELEGNGCYIRNITISNLTQEKTYTNIITGEENYHPVGIFECVTNGTIKNLAVVNGSFEAYESLGAIAGQGDNITVENCYVKDTYLSKTSFTDEDGKKVAIYGNIGGIVGTVGNNGCNISNCKTISLKRNGVGAAGIVYVSFGPAIIKNCQVIDLSSNDTEEEELDAGIINYAKNRVEIDGCNVQNLAFSSDYRSSGRYN